MTSKNSASLLSAGVSRNWKGRAAGVFMGAFIFFNLYCSCLIRRWQAGGCADVAPEVPLRSR